MLTKTKQFILRLLPTRIAGWLRAWRNRRLISTFKPRIVEHTYGNGSLRVWLTDPLAVGWYDHDWPELPEITLLRKHRLRKNARVFDLGSHQGVVALMLAREVGDSGQVVALEAIPHNSNVADKNRELNGMRQIEVLQGAISDKEGKLVFNENLCGQIDDGSLSGGNLTVNAMTIDGLAERFGVPDVVFIDVEGAECLALEGASRVLKASTDWFVELHVGCGLEKLGGSVERVLACFPSDRFTLLGRAEEDSEFRAITVDDALFRDRFFLLALAR